MDFAGKRVLVTGASSGIGLCLTRELDRLGARVMAVARSIDGVDLECKNACKLTCDVSIEKNVDMLFEEAVAKLGGIDVLMINAGFAYYGRMNTPDWAAVERIFRLNVFSAVYSAAKMRQLNGDAPYRVVITASAMSFLSVPGYALYSATKAALRGFAAAYRYELKEGQKLHMVYPIATRTGFFNAAGDGTPVPWPSQTPETVADAIIRGVSADRDDIFPSRVFRFLNILNGFFPLVHRFIGWFESRKLPAA